MTEVSGMKIYEAPVLDISYPTASDVVTVSAGDTEYDEIEW